MLHYAVIFLVIALIAGVLGFSGVAGTASSIAWILFVVFLILAAVSFFRKKARPYGKAAAYNLRRSAGQVECGHVTALAPGFIQTPRRSCARSRTEPRASS